MNITCLFCTWPYSCIWLRNKPSLTKDEGETDICILGTSQANLHTSKWQKNSYRTIVIEKF